MAYLQKCDHVCFHGIFIWLILYFEGATAQLCNPLTQNETNTVEFCKDWSTTGRTVFLISGAPILETVHSCSCELDISADATNIYLSYTAGNVDENCGVEINIDEEDVGFACASEDLVVQTIKTVEFSRSTTTETNLCLEIGLGDKTNSSITVKCTTEQRSVIDTTTKANNDAGNNKRPSTTDTGNTYTDGKTQGYDAEKLIGNGADAKKGNGAVIGGIVGGVVACLAVIASVVIFICLRRHRRDKNPSRYDTSCDQGDLNISKIDNTQSADNKDPDKEKLDDDIVVTYNAMYNIETVSDSGENAKQCDKISMDTAKHTIDYLVITDNVMYNVGSPPTKEEQYAVPSQGGQSTNSPFGDERESQIYHEIESGSPVATKCGTNWYNPVININNYRLTMRQRLQKVVK